MAQERARGLLPAHHADPLVIQLRQITPGLDNICIMLAEQRLRRGAHAKPLRQLFRAAVRHPCDLGRKALYMILLLLEERFGDKHRHANVFMPGLFKLFIEHALNILPNRVAIRAEDQAAAHAGIVDQLGLFHDIRVPLGEVLPHRGDRFDHLFILCHRFSSFQAHMRP